MLVSDSATAFTFNGAEREQENIKVLIDATLHFELLFARQVCVVSMLME